MNVSAWSIRNPIPAMLLFIMLTLRRPDELPGDEDPELPRHRPADGHGDGVAARRLAGAARDRGRAQDRELDRHAAGRQAHLHQGAGRRGDHHRRVPPREADAGGGRRRARRGRARALRPARRPARPGRSPRWSSPGAPILTYTVASSRMDDEALSLVRRQHTSPRRCSAVRGVGAVARVGGVDARGAGRARPGAAAGAERHRGRHLAPAAPGAAGGLGRPRRRRRRRAVGAHHRHRADRPTSWRAWRSRSATAAASASTRWRRVSDTVAEQRSRRAAERQAGGRLRDRAHARRRRDRRGRRRARRARRAARPSTPTSPSPRPSTSSTRCRRTTTAR